MTEYEYKVVPAPTKGIKAKGVKTAEGRFAFAVESLMNEMARDGWEYLRADMLPSEERQGLTGSTTNWRNILVFRRASPAALGNFNAREVVSGEDETADRVAPPPLRKAPTAEPAAPQTGTAPKTGITAALKARSAASKAAS